MLLDAGDFFQGTPYFNKYKGEVELKLMSEMGYDAATIGFYNNDFHPLGAEENMTRSTGGYTNDAKFGKALATLAVGPGPSVADDPDLDFAAADGHGSF